MFVWPRILGYSTLQALTTAVLPPPTFTDHDDVVGVGGSTLTSLTAAATADDDDIWWNLDIFPHNQMLTGWSWSVSPDCTVTSDQLILSSEESAIIRIYDSIQELRFNKIVLFFMLSRSARKVNQIIWTTSAKFHRIAEICLKTKKLEFYTEIWNKVILTLRVESGATI